MNNWDTQGLWLLQLLIEVPALALQLSYTNEQPPGDL
jgi:hypothetical protein